MRQFYDPAATGNEVVLTFSEVDQTFAIGAVLDLDPEGAVVGIEMLGLLDEYPNLKTPGLEVMASVGVASVSIDSEANAMYVKLQPGVISARQEARSARLAVGVNGMLAEVRILPGS